MDEDVKNQARALINKEWHRELLPVLEENLKKPYALIKGEALSFRCYGQSGRRLSGDIDVLIDRHDIQYFTERLNDNGFYQHSVSRRDALLAKMYSHQVSPFFKKTPFGTMIVDLNFDMLWGEWKGEHVDIGKCLERAESIPVYDFNFRTLNVLDGFVQLCLHHYKDMNSVFHLSIEKTVSTEKFMDIYTYWKNNQKNITLKEIRDYLPNNQISPYVYYMMFYTAKIYPDQELMMFVKRLQTSQGDKLLDVYGLDEHEKTQWIIPFERRLDNSNLPSFVQATMTDYMREKVERERRIFLNGGYRC